MSYGALTWMPAPRRPSVVGLDATRAGGGSWEADRAGNVDPVR